MSMKLLILGGGGREHALAWACSQSPRVSEIVVAPGNGGIAAWGASAGDAGSELQVPVRCVPLEIREDSESLAAMITVVLAEAPDLTIVGPEVPLALGFVDELEERGFRVFGPSGAAAELETSKAFAKQFMHDHDVPTAAYAICSSVEEVRRELPEFLLPVVIKADGLAAGKGVVICATLEEAEGVAAGMFSGELLGAAVEQVVLEEFLEGEELSFFALCDGAVAIPLAAAQDHKRIGEGDTGPNTGGMGAYSTDALMTDTLRNWLNENVAQRVVDGMASEGTPFKGILFCGIMLVPQAGHAPNSRAVQPMVLEFNTRFGDPETQALVMRLQTDIVEIFDAAIDGTAEDLLITLKPGASVCVIAASEGYPGKYPSGRPISGLDTHAIPEDSASALSGVEEVFVFHSGTAFASDGSRGDGLVTAGGRVLGVTARAADLRSALHLAYTRLAQISFDGMQYRKDIGWRALQ
jgi:phosphoribosylamine--glycine ligase